MIVLIAAALTAAAPLSPAEAIAAAQAHPERGVTGDYAMTVASANRTLKAVFLNSSEDYRDPNDVTVSLSIAAAHELEKRFGAKPEAYLLGKRVVVHGAIRMMRIANLLAGEPRSFNRFQHVIEIRHASELQISG